MIGVKGSSLICLMGSFLGTSEVSEDVGTFARMDEGMKT